MHVDGEWFKDDQGRTLIFRGVNLGGSSKLPTRPNGATYRREGFFDHRDVSFVGRPFPLDEADEHFARLRHWGMTFVRFLITWEAIEHAGPGQYDTDYLRYVRAVLEKAAEHGIQVFIDPHQDAWSRWTGGDGAPGWTLEAVGMDLTKLHQTGATISHPTHGDPYPRMIWPTNYYKLGAGTMFTLFFAGDDFAPDTLIDGTNTREYLQTHYINAVMQVAHTVKDLPNVVGFDTLNEPASGFIGIEDISRDEPHGMLTLGASPTPLQAMALGSGHAQLVSVYRPMLFGPQRLAYKLVNPQGVSLWQDGHTCVWRRHGVWTDRGTGTLGRFTPPRILKPYYFHEINGRQVNFVEDYLKPFWKRFLTELRSVREDWIVFLEGVPNTAHPNWNPEDGANVAYAGHWYDNTTLFFKAFRSFANIDTQRYRPVVGTGAVQGLFNRQLREVRAAAAEEMGGIPAIVGEFGLPFDLHNKTAFESGDFSKHETALTMYYDAMDANLLSCTLWNYTADNTNAHGDGWNDEDLSIFSRDQQTGSGDINDGGRALGGVVRPYPAATAGTPLHMHYDRKTRTFRYEWKPEAPGEVRGDTELFIPHLQFPDGYEVEGTHGLRFEHNEKEQRLCIAYGPEFTDSVARIVVKPRL